MLVVVDYERPFAYERFTTHRLAIPVRHRATNSWSFQIPADVPPELPRIGGTSGFKSTLIAKFGGWHSSESQILADNTAGQSKSLQPYVAYRYVAQCSETSIVPYQCAVVV